ncbi:MAG: AMP-binding protein [Flammeovirgaceae bacterium]|nr:AMP-binding protein [Flammeovirgaceae bacterium]
MLVNLNFIRNNSSIIKSIQHFRKAWNRNQVTFEITTSGSTGKPAVIRYTRQQAEASARLTIEALQLNNHHSCLLCLDPKFIAGQMMMVRALVAGMKLIAVEPSSNPLASLPPDLPVDFAAFVPLQIQTMMEQGYKDRLFSITKIIIGGAPLASSVAEKLIDHPGQVYLTYGMTETLSHIALRKINGADRSEDFHLLPGIELTQDKRGCAFIKTPFLEKGIQSNDMIELTGARSFRLLGRADLVINSGGIKINPEKVEQSIESFLKKSKVENFFVGGVPDEALGQKVVLFIEGSPFDTRELSQYLKGNVSRYEVPKEIIFIPEFERTATQKISRVATLQKLTKN